MKPRKARINWRSQLMGMLLAGPYLLGLLIFLLLPLTMNEFTLILPIYAHQAACNKSGRCPRQVYFQNQENVKRSRAPLSLQNHRFSGPPAA